MTDIEIINKEERLLHSAKGELQSLKQKRWIDNNYKKIGFNPEQIRPAEQKVETHRKTLAKLYQLI